MRYTISLTYFLAGLSFARAASNTLEFPFPGGYEGVDPVASVVEANPSTTVLNVACPTGVDSSECGFGPGFDYSIISTTIYSMSMSESDFTMTFSCDHNTEAAQMTCGISMGGEGANFPGTTVAVLAGTDVASVTATVTAGADLLEGNAGQTAPAGKQATPSPKPADPADPSPKSPNPASPASPHPATPTPASPATPAGATPTPPQSTGAAGRMGVSAMLGLVGVAALGAW